MNKSKRQGTKEETDIVAWLRDNGFPQARRLAEGGSNDEGDVEAWPGGPVIECKARETMQVQKTFGKALRKSNRFKALIWKRLVKVPGSKVRAPADPDAKRVVIISMESLLDYFTMIRDRDVQDPR